jgi:molecular chaperone DnaJ
VRARRAINVKIPAGVDSGTRVQLTGEGEVGPGGGPAGDLYVEIDVASHPVFSRHGDDLVCMITLPMTAAALGTTIELPTLEADISGAGADVERTMTLDVRPGIQSGEQLTVRGRGVPRLRGTGRGDVITNVIVETPTKLDHQQTELLRQLAGLRDEKNPVASLEENRHKGVFGRFRDAFGGNR